MTGFNVIYISRQFGLASVILIGMLLTGCVSVKQFVDPTLPKVTFSDMKSSEVKQAVQVFFEYQTNGAANAKATEYVRPMVLDILKKSDLFSEVLMAPAMANRKLFITINNVYESKDSASKGFATGLTLGLAGSMVTDGFLMNGEYVVPGKAEVKHNYKHALHTTIGNADGPPGMTPVEKGTAVKLIMDGLVLNLLNDLNRNGELK